MFFVCHPKIFHKHCFQFLLGPFYLPRETEGNGYAKCWGDKQRALWYVMVFFVVLNCATTVNMSVIVKLIILNTLPIDAV